jgi:hypothetical protein
VGWVILTFDLGRVRRLVLAGDALPFLRLIGPRLAQGQKKLRG